MIDVMSLDLIAGAQSRTVSTTMSYFGTRIRMLYKKNKNMHTHVSTYQERFSPLGAPIITGLIYTPACCFGNQKASERWYNELWDSCL